MGLVCVMRPGFWPAFRNQALLGFNTSWNAGFSYENRFSIAGLGTTTGGLIIPARNSSLGMTFSHFGFSGYSRLMTGIACGLKLAGNLSAGVQIDYFAERTPGDYENFRSVTFEGGLFFRPSSKVSTGIHIFNPVPNSLRKTMMPSTIRAGAGIELSRVLFAGAEAEMTTGQRLIIRTGFEYAISESFWLRGGFSTENTSFTFGLGYLLRSVKIDLSFATHEKLGITSGASLTFRIK